MISFGQWTVAKRLIFGFGLSALTLLTVAYASYFNASRTIENGRWLKHSYEVRDKLQDLLVHLIDSETGVRGFVITGDETFLNPYTAASEPLPAAMEELRRLISDNPEQVRRMAVLEPLVERKIAQFRNQIEVRRSQGLDAAVKITESGIGANTMSDIRATIKEANREEDRLLELRALATADANDLTRAIILAGGAIGILAVAGIGWFISRSLADQIGTAVGQVRNSSAELQAVANQQASGAKEQATAMTEISTTMSELLMTSRQIAASAQRVAQTSEQTANAALLGAGTVGAAHESIASIRRQVDQIVSHMLELGRKSQEVGAVLDIVSELAEQTNILAINATIEAAGAGETGKRFAVVADEIRKLADRVTGSTKEVRGLIDDVRSAVNTTVMATETGSKVVDAGSRQFGDVASGFKQIADLVTTTTDAAREIELSTKQQASAVEQVNVAIAHVAQASMETETSAGQTLQTVSQMTNLSTDLLRIIRPQTRAA
ncbi:hypothetical protein IZ6_29770 [Terrihabitans soli]|uniref:Methyl-accepting transducer domain-containing protein n=1 Tax=Terrihabitans soli TaxID=708113 RepID=A0A6S6QY94_9HYPH|nr:CHASE3 domain-containing protein [Terrihabitans soli]BCJ92242.1 hypothetical protein IZ6_29770 [Terrihabitans soli]